MSVKFKELLEESLSNGVKEIDDKIHKIKATYKKDSWITTEIVYGIPLKRTWKVGDEIICPAGTTMEGVGILKKITDKRITYFDDVYHVNKSMSLDTFLSFNKDSTKKDIDKLKK